MYLAPHYPSCLETSFYNKGTETLHTSTRREQVTEADACPRTPDSRFLDVYTLSSRLAGRQYFSRDLVLVVDGLAGLEHTVDKMKYCRIHGHWTWQIELGLHPSASTY